MNNSELERWLKSAPAPERDAAYWEAFPRRILAHLRHSRTAPAPTTAEPAPRPRAWRPVAVGWALGFAAACVLLGFILGFWQGRDHTLPAAQTAQLERYLQEVQALFPNQVRAIVFGAAGPHLVLAEHADVAPVQPVCVKLCQTDQPCTTILTFSGQTIQVNGQTCEVLLDARGEVFLVGPRSLWSRADPKAFPQYHIEAQPLTRL